MLLLFRVDVQTCTAIIICFACLSFVWHMLTLVRILAAARLAAMKKISSAVSEALASERGTDHSYSELPIAKSLEVVHGCTACGLSRAMCILFACLQEGYATSAGE